jgi:hypothetical protein
MLDIAAGLQRKMPRARTINLGKLVATSKLNESGGFAPLPRQTILAQNINGQRKAFSLANADLTSESAELARSTTEAANNPSSQSRQTAAAQSARETEETNSASPTANNGNRRGENRGNSGNNQNRGNGGNNENQGNRW